MHDQQMTNQGPQQVLLTLNTTTDTARTHVYLLASYQQQAVQALLGSCDATAVTHTP
jgi:hypothetical protein